MNAATWVVLLLALATSMAGCSHGGEDGDGGGADPYAVDVGPTSPPAPDSRHDASGRPARAGA